MEQKVQKVQKLVDDLISELPDVLLQHILSFLPTKQVVQSTILSARWKHMWTTFPILRFDGSYFDTKLWRSDFKKSLEIQTKVEFVEKTLQSRRRQRLSINKFTLTDRWLEKNSVSFLDRWIGFVVESDVQQLNLEFGLSYYYSRDYHLPHSVLVAKSITVLTLRCLSLKRLKFESIYLPSLKEISLDLIYADDQIIQNLVAGCPVIEYITFNFCHGFESIKLSNVPKLMGFVVERNSNLERLEIEASNLCSLRINQALRSKLNLLPFKNLKMLSISAKNITEKWLHDHLSGLPLLENLQLLDCLKWERIMVSSQHLKSLRLHQCQHLVELKIDAPKLCKFSYRGVYIKYFSSNALALSQALYFLIEDVDSNVGKTEFLSNLSNSKLLEMKIFSVKNVIIPKELRDTLPSPSYNVKHLKLSIFVSFMSHEIGELLDSLLWISPLPDSLSMKCGDESDSDDIDQIYLKVIFQFSYEKTIYKGDNSSCYKFLPFPCWRHCLKKIKIDSHKGFADREIMYKYFSENAKTLEDFQFHVGAFD